MRSGRIARALLRLYPRDWRERYGAEFLALLAESGLTWRSALDIVFVATIERVSALLALARAEMAPPSPLPPASPQTDREFFLTHGAVAASIAALILLTTQAGLASPHWTVWVQLLLMSTYFDDDCRVTRATIGERIVLTLAWFIVAMWIATVGWLIGDGLRLLGAPEPSGGFLLLAAASLGVPALVRLLYRGISSALNKPRPDVSRAEMLGWSAALFSLTVLVGTADPFGRTIWYLTGTWAMWLQNARTRRARAARRSELRELRGF